VTEADLNYEGSLTVDEDLTDAANMVENEKIQVVNVNNGERIETYLIKGQRGSGICCLNGPAARKGTVGDIVIVISYGLIDVDQAKGFKPTIIFPKAGNKL
jgi:aspartate 1-decarboxylase